MRCASCATELHRRAEEEKEEEERRQLCENAHSPRYEAVSVEGGGQANARRPFSWAGGQALARLSAHYREMEPSETVLAAVMHHALVTRVPLDAGSMRGE